MNKSPQYVQQQTEPKQCKSEVAEDVFTKTWKLAIAAYLKKGGFPARENFSEDTIYVCK